ncbi:MAG TPA: molybdopterin-dependent oxidoreductase [Aldersonia sp.]
MRSRRARALAGIAAALVALGVAELMSALVGPDASPLQALGATVVDHTPQWLREWVIETFGTADKAILFASMLIVAVLVAATAGIIERPTRPVGSAIFAVFGILAAAAALGRPDATWTAALPALVGAAAGIVVLRLLTSRSTEPTDRRDFLRLAGIAAAVGAIAWVGGRWLGSNARNVSADRAAQRLPTPASPAPPIPADADLRIGGVASYVTNNDDFYRIDTALILPQVSTQGWSLRIHGMVDRERTLTFADLTARPAVERLVTLTCVSNPVGGDLIGNARWLGFPVADLLAEAGVHPDSDMVLSRSTDNFTAGTPLEVLTDGRDALIAIGMNGEPLPVAHGYPARLVVPGLYGYVSATKWLTDLEVTRFDRASAYWTQRGWSARGPIKTASRIDVPRPSAKLSPGPVTVAGVAWAQHRGIDRVEVQVDDGPWLPARLSQQYSTDTWRQWAYDWDAAAGPHTLRARATDRTGATQTADVAPVLPDGATGLPAVSVRVG